MEKIDFGFATDVGKVRGNNEDYFIAAPEIGLWLVADGMGGHQAGEVASRVASTYVSEAVKNGVSLDRALARAHHAVIRAGKDGEGVPGMGTTMAALRINGLEYEIAWVGDSRAYLWDRGIRRLTRDHSYVQRLVDLEIITEEEAIHRPEKNIITQALGSLNQPEVKVGSVTGKWDRGQKILLCTDGLTGELRDSEIADILAKDGGNQQIVDYLLRAAIKNGGSDNITIILVSAPEDASGVCAVME